MHRVICMNPGSNSLSRCRMIIPTTRAMESLTTAKFSSNQSGWGLNLFKLSVKPKGLYKLFFNSVRHKPSPCPSLIFDKQKIIEMAKLKENSIVFVYINLVCTKISQSKADWLLNICLFGLNKASTLIGNQHLTR